MPTDLDEPWRDMGHDVRHCNRCHKVVRLYDFDGPDDRQAMLDAHTAFNCVTGPAAPLIGGDRG
jgi:hypothetical protein